MTCRNDQSLTFSTTATSYTTPTPSFVSRSRTRTKRRISTPRFKRRLIPDMVSSLRADPRLARCASQQTYRSGRYRLKVAQPPVQQVVMPLRQAESAECTDGASVTLARSYEMNKGLLSLLDGTVDKLRSEWLERGRTRQSPLHSGSGVQGLKGSGLKSLRGIAQRFRDLRTPAAYVRLVQWIRYASATSTTPQSNAEKQSVRLQSSCHM